MTKPRTKPRPKKKRAPAAPAKPAAKQATRAKAAPAPSAAPAATIAGRSQEATQARCIAFANAYLTNGHNAKAAAIAAGCKPGTAGNAGYRLLQKPAVKALLAVQAEQLADQAALNGANWAEVLRSVLFADLGEIYDADGSLIPVHMLPRHVRTALSSVKMGKYGREYKVWDKTAALQIAARHLGLFERDNKQLSDITVRVELVG